MTAAIEPLPGRAPEPASSLPFSMRMFAEEAQSPWTAAAYRTIADRLERGATWPEAVRAAGPRLPRFLRGVFAIAERTGSVEQVISEHLGSSRRNRRAQRRVLGALLYPAFLMIAGLSIMLGVFAFIVPTFKAMFIDFGIEVPRMTVVLLAISGVIVATWQWLLAGIAVSLCLIASILISTRLPFAAPMLRLMQAIPIIGTASQLAGASEFCTLLGLLVRARIPLPDALRLTASGLRDSNLRQGCLRLAGKIESGESPAFAASILPNFGPRLVQLLRHTSHERTFAEILRSHGELFAIQAEAQAGIAIVWMQPILLLFVGLLGAFVVIALFMPLIKLLNELS